MKTPGHESNVHIPPELFAEASLAAREEHRNAEELVSDAVRRYLQERTPSAKIRNNLAQLLMESPFAGANLELKRFKDYTRPIDL